MGVADEVLAYVRTLVWPCVAVFALILFRRQVGNLIPRIREISAVGASVRFGEQATGLADEAGRMNLALGQVGGELLVVSQFTLLADTDSGRRPSFISAAPPEDARRLYEHFLSLLRNSDVKVEQGEFGAHMERDLVNDGPVTIILESRKR